MFYTGNFLLQIFTFESFAKDCPVGLRETETHRETDRQTQTQTVREIEKEIDRDRDRDSRIFVKVIHQLIFLFGLASLVMKT